MARYELAQLNIGIPAAALDSPQMADFMNNLDRINALAEASPGFVWRLQTEEGNATALRPLGDGAPDAAGILSFELVAVPPQAPEPAGAPRTRELTAGIFVPTLALKEVRGFRVAGAGNVQTLPLPAGAAP